MGVPAQHWPAWTPAYAVGNFLAYAGGQRRSAYAEFSTRWKIVNRLGYGGVSTTLNWVLWRCEHNAKLRTLTRVRSLAYANPILAYADNYLYTMGVWAQR